MNPEQIKILQELSSRTDLPDDKKSIVNELLSRVNVDKKQQVISTMNDALNTGMIATPMAALGAYAAKKIIPPAIDVAKMIPTSRQESKKVKLAQEVRREFVQKHTDKVNEFGDRLDAISKKNPNSYVDISELVSEIQSDPNIDKSAIRILRKTPKLDNILSNPSMAREVSLKDVQDMINHLGNKTKNMDIQDAVNQLRASQLEAFPEMSGVREDYARFIEPYKLVKPKFKVGSLIKNMENKFGDAEFNAAAQEILSPKTMEKINAFRRASNINLSKITSKILGGAGKFASVVPPNIIVPLATGDVPAAMARMMGEEIPVKGSTDRNILEKVYNGVPLTPQEQSMANDPKTALYRFLGGI